MGGNVVSAAIVEGNLIIGLSDGSIINCGRVQGPQGLQGPQGPIGATGDRGTDGNTILSAMGRPTGDQGKDGDFYINTRDWEIYGPKSGGAWGKPKSMLPGPENLITNGRTATGATGGGGGGGEGGGPVYTNGVNLTAATRTLLSTTTGYRVLPNPGAGKTTQEDANRWAFGEVFDRIDEVLPVKISPGVPSAEYVGQLYFDETDSTLYLWDGTIWNPIGVSGSTGGGISGGDSVNALFNFTNNIVQPGEYALDSGDDFASVAVLEISDTDQKGDTYPIEYYKVGSQIRVRNVDVTGQDLGTGEFDGVITAVTSDSPDTYRITVDRQYGVGTASDLARVRVAIAITVDDLDERYVEAAGDTMTGALSFKQPDVADPNGPLVDLGSVAPLANGELSSLIINADNHLLLNSHKDIKLLAHSADTGYSGGFLEINETDLHATVYNYGQLAGEFQLKNTGAYLTGKSGVFLKGTDASTNKLETPSGPVVTWGSSGISLNSKKVENVAEPTQDHHAATKGYVDAADNTKVSKDGDEVFGPLVISRPNNSDPNGQTYEIGRIDGDYDFHPDLQLNAEGSMTLRSTRGFDFYSKYPNQDGSAVFSFDDTGIRANIRDTDNQPSLEIALQDGISRIIAHKGLEIVGYDTGTNYLGYNQGEDRKAKTLSWSSEGIDLHDKKIANVATPTANTDAATKEYVDANSGLVTISDGTPGTPAVGKMWYDTSKSALYLRIS